MHNIVGEPSTHEWDFTITFSSSDWRPGFNSVTESYRISFFAESSKILPRQALHKFCVVHMQKAFCVVSLLFATLAFLGKTLQI